MSVVLDGKNGRKAGSGCYAPIASRDAKSLGLVLIAESIVIPEPIPATNTPASTALLTTSHLFKSLMIVFGLFFLFFPVGDPLAWNLSLILFSISSSSSKSSSSSESFGSLLLFDRWDFFLSWGLSSRSSPFASVRKLRQINELGLVLNAPIVFSRVWKWIELHAWNSIAKNINKHRNWGHLLRINITRKLQWRNFSKITLISVSLARSRSVGCFLSIGYLSNMFNLQGLLSSLPYSIILRIWWRLSSAPPNK